MQAQQWYMTFPAEAKCVMHDGVSHRFALNLHCWTDENSTDSSINQVVNHKKKHILCFQLVHCDNSFMLYIIVNSSKWSLVQ